MSVVDPEDGSRLCGVGEQGKLLLRAGLLGEGYLGDDEKTAELNRTKFVSNWFIDPNQWTQQYERQVASGAHEAWRKLYKGLRDRLYRKILVASVPTGVSSIRTE